MQNLRKFGKDCEHLGKLVGEKFCERFEKICESFGEIVRVGEEF